MSELRWHPVLGQWVVVADHRQERTYKPPQQFCPLCPTENPEFPTELPNEPFDVAVFDNKFPAFRERPERPSPSGSALYHVAPAQGVCEVVVYSADHTRTLTQQSLFHIRKLVEVWAHRYQELSARPEVEYVLIFENRGEAVGVTLHHPHGQIYAFPFIPPVVQRKQANVEDHLAKTGTCLFCDILDAETAGWAPRVIYENPSFVVFVPFFARFPFETMVLPRRHVPSLPALGNDERWQLAEALQAILRAYDGLFDTELPYMMVMYPESCKAGKAAADQNRAGHSPNRPGFHFHIEFLPIQRTATKLKYLAGSETGAGTFITDMRPEAMAASLRESLARASGAHSSTGVNPRATRPQKEGGG